MLHLIGMLVKRWHHKLTLQIIAIKFAIIKMGLFRLQVKTKAIPSEILNRVASPDY